MENQERQMALLLYEQMKALPIRTEISIEELAKTALKVDTSQMFEEWWRIMEILRKVMHKDRKLRMDFTKHEMLYEGLPFKMDFVLLKWGQRIYTPQAKVARQLARENMMHDVRFLMYWPDMWIFTITDNPELVADVAFPPLYIIVDDDMKARFSTTEESISFFEYGIHS